MAAEEKIKNVSGFITAAEDTMLPIFNRYASRSNINKWQQMTDKTINESKNRGIPVIIINKSKRLLVLYNKGVLFKTYNIGLGRNGFSSINFMPATTQPPKGEYRIIKKISAKPLSQGIIDKLPE